MTVHDLFIDFALASGLILVGQLLRAKITLFQRFFMPASMIAGFLGLILGPSVLGILPFSDSIGSYAGVLIILIFTVVGVNGFELGAKGAAKGEVKRVFGYQIYKLVAMFIQFFIPIAITLGILVKTFPELNPGFGILLASGFLGGHGTAAAVGNTFNSLGWTDAMDLGMTFATIGILSGVFGGLALIKYATKKGYTGYIKDFTYISGDLKTGLVTPENRESIGKETISSVSLDTLCFHLSIILGIGGAGYLLNRYLAKNVLSGIPDFTIAYLLALALFLVFRKTKVYGYIDKNINNKISGTATDYLVFFGIAAIKITVIIEYAMPLLLMTLVGLVIVFLTVFPLGYAFNKDSWFERSIFVYGYSTGVFAIGFVLLRIVDPNNKSKTVEDTAMSPIGSFIEILLWSTVPALLVNGKGWIPVIITAVVTIILFIVAILTKTWWIKLPLSKRKFIGVAEESQV